MPQHEWMPSSPRERPHNSLPIPDMCTSQMCGGAAVARGVWRSVTRNKQPTRLNQETDEIASREIQLLRKHPVMLPRSIQDSSKTHPSTGLIPCLTGTPATIRIPCAIANTAINRIHISSNLPTSFPSLPSPLLVLQPSLPLSYYTFREPDSSGYPET